MSQGLLQAALAHATLSAKEIYCKYNPYLPRQKQGVEKRSPAELCHWELEEMRRILRNLARSRRMKISHYLAPSENQFTRNPKWIAAIRHHHLAHKGFRPSGQHLWMQSASGPPTLVHQSMAPTVWR